MIDLLAPFFHVRNHCGFELAKTTFLVDQSERSYAASKIALPTEDPTSISCHVDIKCEDTNNQVV